MSSERTRNTDIKTAVTKTKGHEHKIDHVTHYKTETLTR